MAEGQLVISIDLELAWGVWDHVSAEDLRLAETDERSICAAMIALFDRHQIPATWAMVAALLDAPSAASRPGKQLCWYAPDVVDRILGARARHEIGSHGGRHVYFDAIAPVEAEQDLAFARDLHRRHSLPFESFVFPRNGVGHLDVLSAAGLRVFRGPDLGWANAADRAGRAVRRLANFADKALPVPPAAVHARPAGCGLVDVPGSMLLLGRNGIRRFVTGAVTRAKLAMGLDRARRDGGIFHLWFHPSNFYFRREEQFATLAWFLARAEQQAGRGDIEVRTMGQIAAAQVPPPVLQ